ncbi:ABC transporter permease [Azospirillum picis]|uniref:NitT/TauT family transport system permease protein n=1 Tax=Azospirillum picis TaxID=488438 RepID=A0ABU0MHD6_9PROT|nr:ABC transporter permease [Azospirillum picis]MBP2299015.1 NitT/TauT family transport system permease protein [Azospirillum picis]MDQ0532743.1 NitT/TauT family transport system permease protein [Azospirillum picis]
MRLHATSRWVMPVLSILLLLAVWQSATLAIGGRLLPGPATVAAALLREAETGALFHHLGITLLRVLGAFTIAMSVGVALGVPMGRSALLDRLFGPWLVFFLNLPALVVIVLAYVWFGLTEAAAVGAVAVNKIPNTMVLVRAGARSVDEGLMEMARVYRLSPFERLRHVLLPQLTPTIAAAARSGLALIWKIVLVVELLGRSDGVGFQINLLFQTFDVAGILAYTVAFVAIVQLLEYGLLQPVERHCQRWRRIAAET